MHEYEYESMYPSAPLYDGNPVGLNSNNYQNLQREAKFREVVHKHEISLDFAQRLQQLHGFKICFIFDDSGSMNNILDDSPLNTQSSLLRATRWDELQYFSKIALEIATLFDPNGCSIYFLNKKPNAIHNVKYESQLEHLFADRPSGFTPLTRVLDQVLDENTKYLKEGKLLIIICTDGEPTDSNGNIAIKQFKDSLLKRGPRVYTTIVACTDDDEAVRYLNKWDRELDNLDVVDDYRSERKEVKAAQGSSFPFSFGDYVVKSLIGSIDPVLDNLDEKKHTFKIYFVFIILAMFYVIYKLFVALLFSHSYQTTV